MPKMLSLTDILKELRRFLLEVTSQHLYINCISMCLHNILAGRVDVDLLPRKIISDNR
jgi:uncharacterized membrane protein